MCFPTTAILHKPYPTLSIPNLHAYLTLTTARSTRTLIHFIYLIPTTFTMFHVYSEMPSLWNFAVITPTPTTSRLY